jgi:oligopeptide/dipeptide ABC transporter ATP-binding protein
MNDLEAGLERAARPAESAEHHDTDVVQGVSLGKYFHQRARSFGRSVLVRAVHEATIGIARAETVGLVGESGSGKTTLGRLLLRLLEPSFGKVMFDGRDITHLIERDLRPLRRNMQLLFQDAPASLDGRMTVEQIVAEPLRIHGSAGARTGSERERVAALLARVGLPPSMAGRRPAQLSSGQCQRVSIARALALDPVFIVCDEPVASLDVSEQLGIIELLGELQAARSLAYLFISHDLRLVLGSSQRVYVMYAGRIVECASSAELREAARHPYTRSLLHAVPEPDPKRRRLRLVLDGEPPSPFQPLVGCAFHPRCPRARSGVCDTDAPPLAPIGLDSHHDVACWYPHE